MSGAIFAGEIAVGAVAGVLILLVAIAGTAVVRRQWTWREAWTVFWSIGKEQATGTLADLRKWAFRRK